MLNTLIEKKAGQLPVQKVDNIIVKKKVPTIILII